MEESVGCLGYITVEISLQGWLVSGAWTANWMVERENRSVGLGPMLMQELTRQFDITLALGLSSDVINILPRMGWADFGELKRYLCILNVAVAGRLLKTGRLKCPVEISSPLSVFYSPIDYTIIIRLLCIVERLSIIDSVICIFSISCGKTIYRNEFSHKGTKTQRVKIDFFY